MDYLVNGLNWKY